MVTDVNETYLSDHFATYSTIVSLCGIPEINIMLYVT